MIHIIIFLIFLLIFPKAFHPHYKIIFRPLLLLLQVAGVTINNNISPQTFSENAAKNSKKEEHIENEQNNHIKKSNAIMLIIQQIDIVKPRNHHQNRLETAPESLKIIDICAPN